MADRLLHCIFHKQYEDYFIVVSLSSLDSSPTLQTKLFFVVAVCTRKEKMKKAQTEMAKIEDVFRIRNARSITQSENVGDCKMHDFMRKFDAHSVSFFTVLFLSFETLLMYRVKIEIIVAVYVRRWRKALEKAFIFIQLSFWNLKMLSPNVNARLHCNRMTQFHRNIQFRCSRSLPHIAVVSHFGVCTVIKARMLLLGIVYCSLACVFLVHTFPPNAVNI